MKSYTCIVEGTVNGGLFQSWVRDAAEQLNLKGWVRNIADEKAEILLQGEVEAYSAFRDKLKTEAPIPDLKGVSCKSIDYDKTFDGFETRG